MGMFIYNKKKQTTEWKLKYVLSFIRKSEFSYCIYRKKDKK